MTDDLTPQGAAAVRLAVTVVQLKAERDRARGIAVALEQRLARVNGLIERLSDHARDDDRGVAVLNLSVAQSSLRAALEADQ